MHSYYELDGKYKDMAAENKSLKNETKDLKKRLDYASIALPGPSLNELGI